MIQFIHKKHIGKDHSMRFVIYYSLSDIILGFLLVTLVGFLIYNYLELNLFGKDIISGHAPVSFSPLDRLNLNKNEISK